MSAETDQAKMSERGSTVDTPTKGQESVVKPHLFLSFWDLCLDNLPEGRSERRTLPAADARAMIRAARENNVLKCVNNDDLIAPYRQTQRRNHEAPCAVLNNSFASGRSSAGGDLQLYLEPKKQDRRCGRPLYPS